MNTTEPQNRLYELTETDFQFVVDIVYQHTGIVLGEQKREMVYRRLMRCVRSEKCQSITEYCNRLRRANDVELTKFFNAITTNLTNFYRESHHFDYLKNAVVPEVLKLNASSKRMRVWSAACSTGEEPYSIAITLADAMRTQLNQWDVKILATDLDTDVLLKAKQGVYHRDRVKDIDSKIVKSWFHQGIGANKHNVKVDQRIRQLITFKQLNLLGSWPMKGPFDVIFCRNVLIYFDKNTQETLISRYFDYLRPGGILMLGHSENIGRANQGKFEFIGKTIFKKPNMTSVVS